MVTPFSGDAVDEAAVRRNAQHWAGSSLSGLVVLGSNGEAAQLDELESDRVIGATRESYPSDKWLIAGTGRESTCATLAATKRAAGLGVDAVLVRTPSFFKPQMTSNTLVRHYLTVADASPVPVLLYNVPMYTGVSLAVEAIEQLAAHENIVGIKESGSDIGRLGELVGRTPPDFAVLAGSATTYVHALAAGCHGGVLALAAIVPDECWSLANLVANGRLADARALQRRLLPLARAVGTTYGVAGLKAALDLLGLAGGAPRPPLLPAPPDALVAIREQLASLGYLTPFDRGPA